MDSDHLANCEGSVRPVRAAGEALEIKGLEYDVFVDVSSASFSRQELLQYLEALTREAGLAGAARSTMVALPAEWELPPGTANLKIVCVNASTASGALYRAICEAAPSGRHLVVVLDLVLPANEVLRRLIEEFDRDPLFGTVQPRFADATSDQVWLLPGDEEEVDAPHPKLTRTGLSRLPVCTITPELLSACMVIRREVVKETDPPDNGLRSTLGELRLLLCRARRRGYRNLVVNHAVVASQLPYARVYPRPPDTDMERLSDMYPDIVRADMQSANLSQRRLEVLLARVYAEDPLERRRMLLDCRGMPSQHDGTSHSMLGFLDGFQALDGAWQFDILTSSTAAEFHELRERYQQFRLFNAPQGTYTAGVLLNQPWSLSTVAELHRHALLVAFNMLDTIAWDIMYVCDERLDALWRFVARFADALFYDSQFTRDRFKARFPMEPRIAECVTYLSLAADEQVEQAVAKEPVGDNILIFGNDFDHKDVRRTLQLLVDAFPLNKIVAIGIDGAVAANVTAMPSGQIDQAVLHRLIAGARVIVFPSFYEGFGIPVVQGLAYGRPVVVRQSPLWDEIAGHSRLPGQLVPFDNVTSLVEAVGRALTGLPLKPLPQGTALHAGEQPLRWQDCAQRIVGLVEELMSTADGRRWQEREEALRAIQLLRL